MARLRRVSADGSLSRGPKFLSSVRLTLSQHRDVQVAPPHVVSPILVLWLVAFVAVAWGGFADSAVADAGITKSTGQRNVLFIISDDLTAESLSCYGNSQCHTPHIDAVASRGLMLTNAYCQYPVCGPSRAAMMSGMYPQSIGVTGNGSAARFTDNMGQRPTMSGLFRSHGYYTARVSKIYHMRVPGDITAGVDGPDHVASWTERFNCQAPEWMTAGEHTHLTNEKLRRLPDEHYNLGFGGAFYVVKGSSDGDEQPDAQAATKAIELLEQHGNQPFFLAVGLVRPHVPLVAPASFYTPYPSDEMKLAPTIDGDWDDIPAAGISKNSKSIGLEGHLDRQREVLSAYYASVAFMDTQVGRIIAALDRLQLRENTIVVFTSDHGYHLGEHDFWQKMSLHEESTRIPLVISVPGEKPSTSGSLAEQIDIYPTLAELCGLEVPEHCQGKSLKSLFADPSATIHDWVYCLKNRSHLLRTQQWALIEHPDGSSELYNMVSDPRQYTNLADESGQATILAELKRSLAAKLRAIGTP